MDQATRDAKSKPLRQVYPEVLTQKEAAEYLRVSETEIGELVHREGLPGRKIGGKWRFLKSALHDWLRSPLTQKEKVMELAGAWKDDPHLDDMLEEIYEQRGRSMKESNDS